MPVTVTYFSDHGEDLYLLDGRSGHGAASYSKHQFDIPAFVWVNSAYRAAHPDKVQAMEQNAGKEIRSHNVFYSVADLMGIRWPDAKPDGVLCLRSFRAGSHDAAHCGSRRHAGHSRRMSDDSRLTIFVSF